MGTMGADGSVETNWFVLLHRRSPTGPSAARATSGGPWWRCWRDCCRSTSPSPSSSSRSPRSRRTSTPTSPSSPGPPPDRCWPSAWRRPSSARPGTCSAIAGSTSSVCSGPWSARSSRRPRPMSGMLLFARALDGVQGAATGTASMAIILELFSRQDRVKALGWWSLVGAGGPVLGVTLGSPVIQFFGWRTLFWGQLVLLVIASVVVALLLPSDKRVRRRRSALPAPPAKRRRRSAAGPPVGRPLRQPGVWDGMDWVGIWSLAGSVTVRHAGAEHWPHRRLECDRQRSPVGCRRRRPGGRLRPPADDVRHAARADDVLAAPELHVPDGNQGVRELRLLRRLLLVPAAHGAGLRLQRVPGRLHFGGPATGLRHQHAHRGLHDRADRGADGDAVRRRVAARCP